MTYNVFGGSLNHTLIIRHFIRLIPTEQRHTAAILKPLHLKPVELWKGMHANINHKCI